MKRCSWAGCRQPEKHHDGEWGHCAEHWEQHLAFEEEERTRDRMKNRTPAPPKERSSQRLRDVQTCVALGMDTTEIAEHLGLNRDYVKALRRDAGVPAGQRQAECGTRSGYQRHRTLGQDPCEDCVRAQRKYDAERYGRRRKQAAA